MFIYQRYRRITDRIQILQRSFVRWWFWEIN